MPALFKKEQVMIRIVDSLTLNLGVKDIKRPCPHWPSQVLRCQKPCGSLTGSLQTTSTHVPHALCAAVPCSSALDVLTAATMLYGHCAADRLP